jgi:pyruvate dehydrogenase E2 component (dihydrolipoamide acetyltransferase)
LAKEKLTVPDIGGAEDAEVIELLVAVGERVEVEQSLIVLESDKASMEIPATRAGQVVEILVKVGDTLAEGAAIVVVDTADTAGDDAGVAAEEAAQAEPEVAQDTPPGDEPAAESVSAAAADAEAADAAATDAPPADQAPAAVENQPVAVPDIGTTDPVEVIEICVAVGDTVAEGDSLVVLESDKASMEIPAPFAGEVVELAVAEGAQVVEGDRLAVLRGEATAASPAVDAPEPAAPAPVAETPATKVAKPAIAPEPAADAAKIAAIRSGSAANIYAGPAVRKLAREFGVALEEVKGSGPKGRLLKEDVQDFVKQRMSGGPRQGAASGAGIPPVPEVDFSAFGEVDIQPLSKIGKVTAANMHRSWLNVPHVTQFEEADISEMEEFRASLRPEAEKRGVKLTPLPFLLKACAAALKDNPRLNASLMGDGERLAFKQYVHIGMAVDTPAGLVVPVLRDVDKKNLWQLAEEVGELAQKAQQRKLKPADMQGGCFTISSLGSIGGTGFTPIVNTPEVAILGVSRLQTKPVWDGSEFQPRKMLPLALSYDHRVVNGADGGRFMTQVAALLADIRRLLL